MRTAGLWLAAVVGVGLVAAPAVFGMFTRAPAGGAMLDDFRPFMQAEVLERFDAHLDRADAAAAEADESLGALAAERLQAPPEEPATSDPAIEDFTERWPAASDELGALLETVAANEARFHAVDALPPFALFPWFFVVPGLLAAGLAARGLRAAGRGDRHPRVARIGLAVLGLGLIAAPAVFGMFARAPAGEAMLDDFRDVMTQDTVSSAQQAFLLLASAEGVLRTEVLPDLREAGVDTAQALPAVTAFVEQWPAMAADMSPMVGAMSDNLGRYQGLLALPPFGWFPWFFVGGGLALLVGAAVTTSSGPRAGSAGGDGAPPRSRPAPRSPTSQESSP